MGNTHTFNTPSRNNQQDLEILQLNAVMIFSVVTFATKLNLSGFEAFDLKLEERGDIIDSNLAEFIKSLFLNDMVDWQQKTLAPLSEEIFKQHQCNFVESVTEHHQGGAVHLHIELIKESSSLLLNLLNDEKENIGVLTWIQIQEWVKLVTKYLQQCQQKSSALHTTKTNVEPLLSETLEILEKSGLVDSDKEKEKEPRRAGKEYPFFDHKSLFIYLAQVVYMECHVFETVTEDIESWHYFCGSSFNDHFKVSRYTALSHKHIIQDFPFTKPLVSSPPILLDLAIDKIVEVHAMHVATFKVVDEYLERLKNGADDLSPDDSEQVQLDIWKHFMSKATISNVERIHFLSQRRKAKKAYLKKEEKNHASNENSYNYTPRLPGRFENDTYLLGACSLYQIFSSNGKPTPKVRKRMDDLAEQVLASTRNGRTKMSYII